MYQREVSRATNLYAKSVGEAKRAFASLQEPSSPATMPTSRQSSVVRLPPLPVSNRRMDGVSLIMPSLRIERGTTLTDVPALYPPKSKRPRPLSSCTDIELAPGLTIPISPGLRKAGLLPSIKNE
jgi:hypothetical protein